MEQQGGVLLMKQLVPDKDGLVAEWTFQTFNQPRHHYEMCFGIMDEGKLVGSVMWEAYRVHDIEISYYGPNTMTLGVARQCARLAMDYFLYWLSNSPRHRVPTSK